MPDFQRPSFRFTTKGMCLSKSVDSIPEGKHRILQNVRAYKDGELTGRPGLTQLATVPSGESVQAIKRFYDPPASDWNYFVATQSSTAVHLRYGKSGSLADTSALTAASSTIPSFITYNTDTNSSNAGTRYSWLLYASDKEMVKTTVGKEVVRPLGIHAPTTAPTAATSGSGNLTGDYFYRARFRDNWAGSTSGPGPAMRTALTCSSNKVTVTVPSHATANMVDVYRYGGTLKTWRFVGSAAQGSTLSDNFADTDLASADQLDTNSFQPFLTQDLHRSGRCNTSTNTVTVSNGSGDYGNSNFNPNWIPGATVLIAGVPYTIYSVTSTTVLTTVEDLPTLTGATWDIDAQIEGTPLPYLFGPYGLSLQGMVIFGVGDTSNPGRLYWTNGNDPDTTSLENWVDLTGPNEPLMNGCIYDGRIFVWSSERLYAVYPKSDGSNSYYAQAVPGARGLIDNWAFSVGAVMRWVSRDGVFVSDGGAPASLTEEDLYTLMPHEGQNGVAVDGINPPSIIGAASGSTRLCEYEGTTYFDYVEASATTNTFPALLFDNKRGAWFRDLYTPTVGYAGPILHYGVEGLVNTVLVCIGRYIYQLDSSATSDAGAAISGQIRTSANDFGDPRANKLFGDWQLDSNTADISVTTTLYGNNFADSIVSSAVTTSSRTRTIVDINSGVGVLKLNVGLDLAWSSSSATPTFYEWQPSLVPKPADTKRRATDWTDDGFPGAKFLRGCIIEADTGGSTKSVQVWGDNNAVLATLSVTHSTQVELPYAINPPNMPPVTHEMRLAPQDATSWRLFGVTWIYDKYPEYSQIQDDFSDQGEIGAKQYRGLILEADTLNASVSFQVQADGLVGGVITTPTAKHNGRVEIPYAFTPFIAHSTRLVPLANWRKFKERWIYDPWPELTTMLTAWMDDGDPREKFLQGMVLTADTINAPIDIVIQTDTDGTIPLSVTHNGRQSLPYSWDPVITHAMRIAPSAPLRIWDKEIKWIWEPLPERAEIWRTEPTAHELPGYQTVRDGYIAYMSATQSVLFYVLSEGTLVSTITFPASSAYTKRYFLLPPNKGKSYEYQVSSSAPFRLFKKDCEVRVKEWVGGGDAAFHMFRMFGDDSYVSGARI